MLHTEACRPCCGFRPSKLLTCTIQICRAFVPRAVLNCWISMRLLGWIRFVSSSPAFWSSWSKTQFCGSCRSGKGTGVIGFLPLKGRSLWQQTTSSRPARKANYKALSPWRKQTPLLYIQSSTQTELSRTLLSKFDWNINVCPREREEGKTQACNSFSPWSKSTIKQQDSKVKMLVKQK